MITETRSGFVTFSKSNLFEVLTPCGRTKHSQRLSEGSCREPRAVPSFGLVDQNSPIKSTFSKWTCKKFFRTAKKFFSRPAFLPTKFLFFQNKNRQKLCSPAPKSGAESRLIDTNRKAC